MNVFERILGTIIKPWFFASFLLLIMGFIGWIDLPVAEKLYTLQLQQSMPWLKVLTNFGLGVVYFTSLAVLALGFRYILHNTLWERRIWFLWLSVMIPSMVCLALKAVLGRARPDLWFGHHLYGFYGFHTSAQYWSFPSGHTSTIMGFAFGCSILWSRFSGLFILMGIFVAASRVLLTQHYISDVLFASYLALVSIGLLSRSKLRTLLLEH